MSAEAVIRAAFDDVLAGAGFVWNAVAGDSSQRVMFLYEALPAAVMERVPEVAPYLGDLDGPCLDLWIAYDQNAAAISSIAIEGVPVVTILRDRGHPAVADSVERPGTLADQLAAYVSAFGALFGGG